MNYIRNKIKSFLNIDTDEFEKVKQFLEEVDRLNIPSISYSQIIKITKISKLSKRYITNLNDYNGYMNPPHKWKLIITDTYFNLTTRKHKTKITKIQKKEKE